MTLAAAAAHIGRTVIFMPSTQPGKGPTQVGKITSVGELGVVYITLGTSTVSSAVRPEDIELEVRT